MRVSFRILLSPLILTLLLCTHSSGHDVITTPITFSREISRIFNARCASCHHQGGAAFSLLTYDESRPWAKAIEEEVLERRMPPWGAIRGFGDFQDDQSLTQQQLEIIAEWVEGGAPAGDPKDLPKPPEIHSAAAPAAPAPLISVDHAATLKAPAVVTGIRAQGTPEGSTFMAVARRPDGSTEPLLWIYNYKPRFDHPYWYTASLHLPAGTRIEVSPPVGGVALITGTRH